MSFVEERKALTREKRLSTLSHYNGTLETLRDEVKGTEIKQKVRTFSQVSYDEILFAVRAVSKIEQSAIIVHGAVGCSASGIYFNQEKNIHWYSTNLNERDTILGGDEKLRKAVVRACEEQNPEVVFIVGSPVVAINNDDINAIILELEAELNIKIISIYTDGFKTKAPVSGYDIVSHSLLRHVVEREAGGKEDFINVISFSENNEDIAAVVKLLKDLEIPYQLLPQYGSVSGIRKAGKARATITLNPEEGGYFAKELEEVFGVEYIKTEVPIGFRGTKHFISKIAKALSIEKAAKKYVETQEAIVEKGVKKGLLAGKSVFLDTNLSAAVTFIALIEKLGGAVEGLAIPYVDLDNRIYLEKLTSLNPIIPVMISQGQPFEKANILSKKKIDYYIGTDENVAFAADQGSVPISLHHTAILGYEGIRQFIRQIQKASAFTVEKKKAYYKESWIKKSSNWYVKQEVK